MAYGCFDELSLCKFLCGLDEFISQFRIVFRPEKNERIWIEQFVPQFEIAVGETVVSVLLFKKITVYKSAAVLVCFVICFSDCLTDLAATNVAFCDGREYGIIQFRLPKMLVQSGVS